MLRSALDELCHLLHFVLYEGHPVLAIDVALLAVEVSWLVTLVPLHFLLVVEGMIAAQNGAWHRPDRLKRHSHPSGWVIWWFGDVVLNWRVVPLVRESVRLLLCADFLDQPFRGFDSLESHGQRVVRIHYG